MKKLKWLFNLIDIPSGIIIGLWSLGMLAGSLYSIITTGNVSTPIASMFSVVITAFAGTKISQHWRNKDKINE